MLPAMQKKDPAAVALGRKGGKARLITMTKKQRTEIAKAAAAARWKKTGTK
jgi:DNA-directed RNA polymerase subunit H (RpoH/RPB5)